MPYFLLLLLSLAGSPLSSNHGALAVAASPPRGAEEAGWKSPEFPQTQIPPCSLRIEGTGCFLHPGSLRPPVPGLPPPACGGSQRTGFEGRSPACGSAQLHGEGTSQLCTHWCGLVPNFPELWEPHTASPHFPRDRSTSVHKPLQKWISCSPVVHFFLIFATCANC